MKRKDKQKKEKLLVRLLHGLKTVALVTVLAGTGTVGYLAYQELKILPEAQLSEVDVRGAVETDSKEIESAVRACSPEFILAADLDKIRESVVTFPWISGAIVKRKLPDSLTIEITERKPIAVAGVDKKLYIVDREGIILDPFTDEMELLSHPVVRGLKHQLSGNTETYNRDRMKAYLTALDEFREGEEDYSETISEIDVTDPENISIIPRDDPVVIYLGNHLFRKRYESFLDRKDLYHQIKREYGTLKYIDISFDKQIIFKTAEASISG